MVHVAMNVDVRHTLLVVGYHVGTVVRKHKNTLGDIILFLWVLLLLIWYFYFSAIILCCIDDMNFILNDHTCLLSGMRYYPNTRQCQKTRIITGAMTLN